MVRNENQLLLVRFRGAHDRRTQCEKKLKQCEAELALLRGVRGAQSYQSQGHAQVHPVQQHYAPHAQGALQQQHQQVQQHGHGHPQHQHQQHHQPLPAMLRSSPPPPHPHHAAHPHFPQQQQRHQQQHEHYEHDAHAYEEDGSYSERQQHEQQEQQQEQYALEQHDGGDSGTFELQPLSVEVADADVQPFELAYDSQRPYSPTAVRTQQQRHSPAGAHSHPSVQGGSRTAPGRWK